MSEDLPPRIVKNQQLPELTIDGSSIRASQYVEKGTSANEALGYIVGAFAVLGLGLISYGVMWIVMLISPLLDFLNRKKTMALIKGSGIEVNPHQMPELYRNAETIARRLGLKATPALYIVEANVINAAAAKIGSRQCVVLTDDIVHACLDSGEPRALTFILAHEMAHHALGHTQFVRASLSRVHKKLSRLDEFSCDAVANALVGDQLVSARGVVTMLAGPHVLPYVNMDDLMRQAREVEADKHTKKVEKKMTHPLLLRRLHRFVA